MDPHVDPPITAAGQMAPGAPGAGAPLAMPAPPLPAEDNDTIEREWVKRAQQIISSTALDPYQQARQLNQLKAQYIGQRYSKEVKVLDE